MDICHEKNENDNSLLVFKTSTVLKLCAATIFMYLLSVFIRVAVIAGPEYYTIDHFAKNLFGGGLLVFKALALSVCMKLLLTKKQITFCYILGFILIMNLVELVLVETAVIALLSRVDFPA